MKYLRKNKFAFGLLCFAILSLAVFALGGEYLHSHIHKHESPDARQQCSVYQLQTHIFTAVGIIFAVLFSAVVFADIFHRTQLLVLQPQHILPESHAPPFSL